MKKLKKYDCSQSIQAHVLIQQCQPLNPYDSTQISPEIIQQLERESMRQGFKKTVVVYALKYGGTAMGKICSLSPANGKLLKKRAFRNWKTC